MEQPDGSCPLRRRVAHPHVLSTYFSIFLWEHCVTAFPCAIASGGGGLPLCGRSNRVAFITTSACYGQTGFGEDYLVLAIDTSILLQMFTDSRLRSAEKYFRSLVFCLKNQQGTRPALTEHANRTTLKRKLLFKDTHTYAHVSV